MMEPSFEKLLVLLADAGIKFVVVGGVAVTIQGYVRLTEDVDLLLEDSRENIARLLRTLSGYGEGYASELTVEDFTDEEGAIRIVEEIEQSQMDLFTRMSGKKYENIIVDADFLELSGRRIAVASKHALIGWKISSLREKDQLDAGALRRLIDDPKAFD
jgi:predicted nucleotidyltransferase